MVDASTAYSSVPEPETMPRCQSLTASEQAPKECFVEAVRLLRVHARQRGATDEPSDAQVVQLAVLSAQVADDVAQALPAGQLAPDRGGRTAPSGS